MNGILKRSYINFWSIFCNVVPSHYVYVYTAAEDRKVTVNLEVV